SFASRRFLETSLPASAVPASCRSCAGAPRTCARSFVSSITGAEAGAPLRGRPREPRSLRAAARESIVLLPLLGFVAVLLVVNARRRFEFFDMSAFLDAGYRVAIGQRI